MIRALIIAALLSGCSTPPPAPSQHLLGVRSALILGGSVSSGFSGKPVPEIVAERLGLPYRNEASICHRVAPEETQSVGADTLVINLDGNYWRSYDRDCAAAVVHVAAFYANTDASARVVATVPERNAGWFYRSVCGAQSAEQSCRAAINAALIEGCTGRCMLIDADAIYALHADITDIHLTPEIWRRVADEHFDSVVAKLRSK